MVCIPGAARHDILQQALGNILVAAPGGEHGGTFGAELVHILDE